MNKPLKFLSCVLSLVFCSTAFAQAEGAARDAGIATSGAQFVSALNNAKAQSQAVSLPVPYPSIAGSCNIRFEDITGQDVSNYEVLSAYPSLYRLVHREENMRIIKVFRFTDARGDERRLEVYYTGGDWMRYGYTYFGMNAGRKADRADAYFISELSTTDREGGSVPPLVDPFNSQKLAAFIAASFLDPDGNVNPVFRVAASAPASAK